MSRPDDDPSPHALDPEPTEDELRQAQALAHALERGAAIESLPDDALEAAVLLRLAEDSELDAEAGARIWQELDHALAVREGQAATSDRGFASLRWLWLMVPTLGAAGVMLYLASVGQDPIAAKSLPPPSEELLQAQARWASGGEDERRHFEREMDQYRAQVYAQLGAASK